MTWQLAQVNVAIPRAPLDDATMREFVELLGPVNALADAAPGFVWRLSADAVGDETFHGRLLVNLSVWESLEALRAFAYDDPAHRDAMRRRREWFEHIGDVYQALWWVRAGHRPTVAEAIARLEQLRADGPRQDAFTFREPFPAPAEAAA